MYKPKPLRTIYGDIWTIRRPLDLVVIPVSIGWDRNGCTVMGKGLARKAAQEDPSLPAWLGACMRVHGGDTPVLSRGLFLLFPTQPLRLETPWLSWMAPENLGLLERGMKQLLHYQRADKRSRILLPGTLGCQTGKLTHQQVLPFLKRWWMNRYRLVVKGR